MPNTKETRTAIIALIVLATVFMAAVVNLIEMRFRAGNVFPEYSSLRTDPRGGKAFAEGLQHVGIDVRRNYLPLHTLDPEQPLSMFFLGLDYERFYSLNALEKTVKRGSRLIITLPPTQMRESSVPKPEPMEDAQNKTAEYEGPEENKDMAGNEEKEETSSEVVPEKNMLIMSFGYQDIDKKDISSMSASLATEIEGLPESLPWHSTRYFEFLDEDWNILYTVNGKPVVAEMKLGKGTIVVAADSYFASNESMRHDRPSGFLAWLVGPHRTVVFDETHLGISETPGIAALGRKYRLHGLFFSTVALALLFVWKNSTSLLPPQETGHMVRQEADPSGKDYSAGVNSLLRHNIRKQEVVSVCMEEWSRSFHFRQEELSEELSRVRSLMAQDAERPARERNPVQTYNTISKILSERMRP